MQTRAKPLEQGDLRSIADRVTGWVWPEHEVESEDGEPGTELRDRDTVGPAPFESPDAGPRRARSRGRLSQAETRRDTSLPVLVGEPTKGGGESSSASIIGSFAGCHRTGGSRAAVTPRLPAHLSRIPRQAANGRVEPLDMPPLPGRPSRWSRLVAKDTATDRRRRVTFVACHAERDERVRAQRGDDARPERDERGTRPAGHLTPDPARR
jgi:hypothetical protein